MTISYLSPASLRWFSLLLEERYGHSFQLKVCDHERLTLSLYDSNRAILFNTTAEIFAKSNSDLPFTSWNAEAEGWHVPIGPKIPAPGTDSLPSPLIASTDFGHSISYDVMGLIYWILTRLEEVGSEDFDEHGRFLAISSHAFKHGYLERPVVDEWLDILGQVIQRTWPEIKLKQHRFSVKVSHDVDHPSKYGFRSWKSIPRAMLGDILKHKDPRGVLGPWIRLHTKDRLHPLDAFNTFDWLMDISERNDLVSAFYFICDRRGIGHDADYNLGHPAIRELIRRIHSRGHEIGLHPSYSTYLEPLQIKHEAERLRRICHEEGVQQAQWGGRMHYLQWRQPTTLRAWSSAGMDYDSSMTYADHAGFRCGTCFEYQAFDPVAKEILPIRVRPLIVMEGSVFGTGYMNLGVGDAAREKMLTLRETCRRMGGCFTLLWHNSSFQKQSEKHLYETVVDAFL